MSVLESEDFYMSMRKQLKIAESNARARDLACDPNIQVNLSAVAEQEQKANSLGYGLYKLKQKNKTPFVQHFHENIAVLLERKYMTIQELGFLTALQTYLAMGSNAIKSPKTDDFMTITEIADVVGLTRTNASKTIKRLLEKGLLFEFVNAQEIKKYKRNVSARPLFINPELMYKGNKDQIDATLCDLVMEFDLLESEKIPLPYKVWHSKNSEYGKIITRKKYLENKKKRQK